MHSNSLRDFKVMPDLTKELPSYSHLFIWSLPMAVNAVTAMGKKKKKPLPKLLQPIMF